MANICVLWSVPDQLKKLYSLLFFVFQNLKGIQEGAVEGEMVERREIVMEPTRETLEEDLVNIENNIIETEKCCRNENVVK